MLIKSLSFAQFFLFCYEVLQYYSGCVGVRDLLLSIDLLVCGFAQCPTWITSSVSVFQVSLAVDHFPSILTYFLHFTDFVSI